MVYPFNPDHGLIVVPVMIWGPQREVTVELALDTGATATVVKRSALQFAGFQLDEEGKRAEITTGSGTESVLEVRLARIYALGKAVSDFSVLCHTLPPSTAVDGVLGLDFLRGGRLTIDFRAGLLELD